MGWEDELDPSERRAVEEEQFQKVEPVLDALVWPLKNPELGCLGLLIVTLGAGVCTGQGDPAGAACIVVLASLAVAYSLFKTFVLKKSFDKILDLGQRSLNADDEEQR